MNLKKKPNFTTSFGGISIKPIVSAERDKYLSLASLDELRSFLPAIDLEKNYDLLPIAFDACVVGRVNKNGDVIDTKEALNIYKSFISKFIDIEHDRKNVIGYISNSSFSDFGTSKQLTEEEVKNSNKPFNIALGGIIWRIISGDVADVLEMTNDSTSPHFMAVSASWELGFDTFDIVLLEEGKKNLEDSEIISDPEKVEALKKHLKAFGGTGKIEDGRCIYRKLNNVMALGVGLTQNPAAEVIGVAVPERDNEELETTSASSNILSETKIIENNLIKISQSENNNVNTNRKVMKLTNIKDITDESLKQVTASQIHDFIESEFKNYSEDFAKKEKELSQAAENAKQSFEQVQKDLEKVKAELQVLAKEKAEKDALDKFNQRMASFDEKFELTDEDRKVLAGQIKDLTDDSFAAFEKASLVLMKDKDKAVKKAQAEASEKKVLEDKKKQEVQASAEEQLDKTLENAEVEKTSVAATSTSQEVSLKEQVLKAFSGDNVQINYRKR